MTLRTRIRNLEASKKGIDWLKVVAILQSARDPASRDKPTAAPTQAKLNALARTKLGLALIAAKRRAALIPKGTP